MISTKDIPSSGSNIPKVILPGNHKFFIRKITLDKVPYKEGAYNLSLHIEGEDLGEDFEGFYYDKDQPDLGRYKGQIGKVRTSEWPYADGETKSGIKISRDLEILKAIRNLCIETNNIVWLEKQDNQHETIESLVEQFNSDRPFKEFALYGCIAGKEYVNKAGYINYDLYFPKVDKGQSAFKNYDIPDKVPVYDESKHLKKAKTDTVEKFGDDNKVTDIPETLIIPTTSGIGADFDLD